MLDTVQHMSEAYLINAIFWKLDKIPFFGHYLSLQNDWFYFCDCEQDQTLGLTTNLAY